MEQKPLICDQGVMEALAEQDAQDAQTQYAGDVAGRFVCRNQACEYTVERMRGDGYRPQGYCALAAVLGTDRLHPSPPATTGA